MSTEHELCFNRQMTLLIGHSWDTIDVSVLSGTIDVSVLSGVLLVSVENMLQKWMPDMTVGRSSGSEGREERMEWMRQQQSCSAAQESLGVTQYALCLHSSHNCMVSVE